MSGQYGTNPAIASNNTLKVTITKYGEVGEMVEGSFSAVVTTMAKGLETTEPDREQLIITDGFFSVIRKRPEPEQ